MYMVIDHDEHRLLSELVESRIRELQPEIRRCRNMQYHDELKDELERFRRLLRHLRDCECDVLA